MSSEAFLNPGGQPSDVLLITGSAVLTDRVENIGYQEVVVLGNVLVPRGAESTLVGRFHAQGGRTIAYEAPPRVFDGRHSLSAAYFEFLDQPITLVVHGRCSIEDDVSPELIRAKVAALALDGKLVAPRRVIPALQVVALELNGRLLASEDANE